MGRKRLEEYTPEEIVTHCHGIPIQKTMYINDSKEVKPLYISNLVVSRAKNGGFHLTNNPIAIYIRNKDWICGCYPDGPDNTYRIAELSWRLAIEQRLDECINGIERISRINGIE